MPCCARRYEDSNESRGVEDDDRLRSKGEACVREDGCCAVVNCTVWYVVNARCVAVEPRQLAKIRDETHVDRG
jgi:hypothetical protein